MIKIIVMMIHRRYADHYDNANCCRLQDHHDHNGQQTKNNHNHDHDDDVKVKDPGCRALISLTPEQQERAETIHGFVQVTDNHSLALNTIFHNLMVMIKPRTLD